MNNQLTKLMAQKDISEELMELRRENEIQKHKIYHKAEEAANLHQKVN